MSERILGEKLGKYELRSVLGRGAMGTVYEGFDPVIDRRVAIKTVRLPDAADLDAQDELARFRREAQAAGRLHHPNIVGVFDYGETGELAYIVMEFVDGRTLKSVLEKQERFAPAETVRVMEGLLAGLQYSHERGVVHRDVKPANLILTDAGDVKIADFGIARIESSSMTQAGTVLGTPAYMSPEQFMGQTVDLRTDVYSSGVVLYQLLTGERPFDGSMTAIMHKVLNTTPPRPSELSVTAPPAFDAVIAKAMAKRPEERYASAVEFAGAIRAALERQATLPASVLNASAAPSDATLVMPASARPVAPTPVQPQGSRQTPLLTTIAVAVLLVLVGGGIWLALRPGAPQRTASTVPAAATSGPSAPTVTPQQSAPAPGGAETRVSPAPGSNPSSNVPASGAAGTPAPAATVSAPTAPATPAPANSSPPPASTTPTGRAVTPSLTAATPPTPANPPPTARSQPPPSVAAAPSAPQPAPIPQQALSLPAASSPPTGQASSTAAAMATVVPPVSREVLASALGGVGCSLVSGDITGNGIALYGLVQRGNAEAALRRALAATAPAASIGSQVMGFDGPYCQALDVLRPISSRFGAPGTGLQLSVDGSAAPLQHGDLIIARVTMPDFAGYLRVDYLSHDGSVFHMDAPGSDPTHLYPAGFHVVVGQPTAKFTGWQVDEPYGPDMIIAVASSQVLFARVRPETEQADAYLRELQAAMDTVRRRGGHLAGGAVALVTEPRQ